MIPKKEMDKKVEEIREKYELESKEEVLFLSSLGAGEEGSINELDLFGFNNILSPTGVMERCIVPTPLGMMESGKPKCVGHCQYTDEDRKKMEKKLKPYEIPLLGRILDKFLLPREEVSQKTIENGVLHCMDEKGEKLGFLNKRDAPEGSEEVKKNDYCGKDCDLLDIGEGENVYMIKPDELLKNFMSEYFQPIGEEPQKDPMYS